MNEQRVIKQFVEQIMMQYDVYAMAVYKGTERVCGTACVIGKRGQVSSQLPRECTSTRSMSKC